MLARVQDIAQAPLPCPVPADERHFSACLRTMLAVLPRQQADELSGELFVRAYQQKLGHYPDAAVTFLADKAMERCRWFPTIAECLELLTEWRREDDHTRRRHLAMTIVGRERSARRSEEHEWSRRGSRMMTQQEVDSLPPALVAIGIKCGALVDDGAGKVRPYIELSGWE